MPSVQTLPDFIFKIKNEILKCNPRTLIIACKSLSDSIFIDWIISLKQINYIEVYTIIPSSGTTNNNLTGVKKLLFSGAKIYIVDKLYQDVLIINSNKLILGNLSSLLDNSKQQNKYYYSMSEHSWLYKTDLHTFLGVINCYEYDPYKRVKRKIVKSNFDLKEREEVPIVIKNETPPVKIPEYDNQSVNKFPIFTFRQDKSSFELNIKKENRLHKSDTKLTEKNKELSSAKGCILITLGILMTGLMLYGLKVGFAQIHSPILYILAFLLLLFILAHWS